MKSHPIRIAQLEEIQKIGLPSSKWKIVRAEIKFERQGVCEEYASVVWDSSNGVFYVKTNKAIVYPDDVRAVNEAIDLMKRANVVMQKSPVETKTETSNPVSAENVESKDT